MTHIPHVRDEDRRAHRGISLRWVLGWFVRWRQRRRAEYDPVTADALWLAILMRSPGLVGMTQREATRYLRDGDFPERIIDAFVRQRYAAPRDFSADRRHVMSGSACVACGLTDISDARCVPSEPPR